MWFRNWDCPLLNSPDLSAQLVIDWPLPDWWNRTCQSLKARRSLWTLVLPWWKTIHVCWPIESCWVNVLNQKGSTNKIIDLPLNGCSRWSRHLVSYGEWRVLIVCFGGGPYRLTILSGVMPFPYHHADNGATRSCEHHKSNCKFLQSHRRLTLSWPLRHLDCKSTNANKLQSPSYAILYKQYTHV